MGRYSSKGPRPIICFTRICIGSRFGKMYAILRFPSQNSHFWVRLPWSQSDGTKTSKMKWVMPLTEVTSEKTFVFRHLSHSHQYEGMKHSPLDLLKTIDVNVIYHYNALELYFRWSFKI
jgi:hypothetical protein